ncbi:MAG: tetratricopeptide repeat protein [Hyphomicrobiales bacterium]|nr:tetratricopeptide repeat protein [Hyphomicrobiales bacterium]
MTFTFAGFVLNTETHVLSRNGIAQAVEPQVFDLLCMLAREAGKLVTKDQMIEEIWGGRIVAEATIDGRIAAARKVVGDDGRKQAVIATVIRRGIRLVVPVEVNSGVDTAIATASGETGAASEPPPTMAAASGASTLATIAPLETNQASLMPTLVVLPFKIASEGLDDYFCDGLTEDVIANLTHFRELRVIASGSSFHFKNRDIPLAEVAEKLGAGYIVDGSVRRAGQRLRVGVQLIDAASGVSLWTDRYDRQLEDIFAVQDAITHMIVASLGVRMQDTALTHALRKSPSEWDAYDCLLRARRYTATLNEAMHAEARDLLERAIELDPNYAEAHALLANVYLAEHRFEANPRPNPIGRALAMALKATQLDPQSAYARCWLAIVHFFQKDIGKFEAEAQRALDLNPNDPEILAEVGHYRSFLGEYERGSELSDRAKKLNPLHPGWYHFSSALLHFHQRRHEDVLVDVQRISMPDFYWTHLLSAAAFGHLDRKEASASLAKMKEVKPSVSAAEEIHKWNVAPRDCAHIMEGLRKAGHDE